MEPGKIEAIPQPIEYAFEDLQQRIMNDVVRRMKLNAGEITRAADWQINRLQQFGLSGQQIKEWIKDELALSDTAIDKIYSDALREEYIRNKALYDMTGNTLVSFEENMELQDLVSSIVKQTKGDLKNITQSLGFVVQEGGKLKAINLTDYYTKTLDGAVSDILSGSFDYNTVLKRVTNEMTNSGLRMIDYESGYHNRVDVAARRAVMTGFNQAMSQINEQTAKDLGTDYYEVTYHIGARPEHQVWQGRVYNKRQLVEICGLGLVQGLKGANCYHDYLPFVPGASVRTYTDKQLDQMMREENTPQAYQGKEYTAYEAKQRQRQLETTMRAQKQKASLLEAGGANENDIIDAKARYRVTSQEYTGFSNAMGIPQQRERVTIRGAQDAQDRIIVKKAKVEEIPQLIKNPKKLGTQSDVNDYFFGDPAYKKWENGLSQEDKESIIEYTSQHYKSINSYNRKNFNWKPDGIYGSVIDDAEKFVSELPEVPTQRDGESFFDYKARKNQIIPQVYQDAISSKQKAVSNTARLDDVIQRSELSDDIITYRAIEPDALPPFVNLEDLIGKPYSDPSFVSTSPTLKSAAVNKNYVMQITVPKGKGNGAYLEKYTLVSGENELLLPRNRDFIITGVKQYGEKNIIKMEMLP